MMALARPGRLTALDTFAIRPPAPLSPALKDVDMYLYLNKKHQALVPKLSQAIRNIKADGSYNRILSAIY